MVIPLILCGGGGTRLWPLSRPEHPKPFLSLLANQPTLFQQALQRAALFVPPLVICHSTHLSLVQQQSAEIGITPCAIILEPQARGTTAAIAAATLFLESTFPDATLLSLPADLVIRNHQAFAAAVARGLPYAHQSQYVTFGIKPTHPETRYGYIETGEVIAEDVFEMRQFLEKPDLETARQWMTTQKYFWNSGMFLFSLQKVLSDFHATQNQLIQACAQALHHSQSDHGIIRLEKEAFIKAPQLTFEKAVIEQVRQGIMVSANFDWSDAGTWQSLWELQAHHAQDNVTYGNTRIDASTGCYIHASTKRISVLGCEDLVVVETADEVLITTRKAAEKIATLAKE